MRIRILDRILVALAGLILIAGCGALIAQMFFQVDVVSYVSTILSKDTFAVKAALVAAAAVLLIIGVYCFLVLFRHRGRRDRFILQKNDNGELAISLKALDNMVAKCLDQHKEITAQSVKLENQKDGLLVRIKGTVAGGISIPLTVESLQKQIKQYVTACSGVEVKDIKVKIEDSGPDAEDAPFAIAAPIKPALLKGNDDADKATETGMEETRPAAVPEPAVTEPVIQMAAESASEHVPEEDDERPIHQRLFSTQQEQCIVPVPPEEAEKAAEEVISAAESDIPAADMAAEADFSGGESVIDDNSEREQTDVVLPEDHSEVMADEAPAEAVSHDTYEDQE